MRDAEPRWRRNAVLDQAVLRFQNDIADRQILLDLDIAIQRIRKSNPEDASILPLTGIYHNLLRRWSET